MRIDSASSSSLWHAPDRAQTGGLADTVDQYVEPTGEGDGFKFADLSAEAITNTIGWGISTYYDRPEHIKQMRDQAMKNGFFGQMPLSDTSNFSAGPSSESNVDKETSKAIPKWPQCWLHRNSQRTYRETAFENGDPLVSSHCIAG